MGWYRALKGETIVVPGRGLVVMNAGSVKSLPDDLVATLRYVEREVLEPLEEQAAVEAAAKQLGDPKKQPSAAKAARAAARLRRALKVGVDPAVSRSPTKARAARAKAKKAAADMTVQPEAPVD